MMWAVLPNTSAREQWLLSGLVGRTTSHGALAFLDGGRDDDVAFSNGETTTADIDDL